MIYNIIYIYILITYILLWLSRLCSIYMIPIDELMSYISLTYLMTLGAYVILYIFIQYFYIILVIVCCSKVHIYYFCALLSQDSATSIGIAQFSVCDNTSCEVEVS